MIIPETIIEAQNLSVGYRRQGKQTEKCVHQELNFSLYAGELTSLLGPNGAGKSTLLRTLATAQLALSGTIMLKGKAITDYKEKALSQQIGLVLTDRTYAGGLTVSELVALGRYPHTGFFGRLNSTDKELIAEAMRLVGISSKANNYVAQLSDGERQKAMIAKALAQECPIIILDEPTAFLDVVSRIEIMSLLHQIANQQKKSVLLSTHDLEQALQLSDRLWLLSQEKGMAVGVTEDLILSGAVGLFLERDNISFDISTGSFRASTTSNRSVALKAPANCKLWLENALLRNEILPVSWNSVQTKFAIEVINFQEIKLHQQNVIETYSSVESTLNALLSQWK